MTFVGKVHPDYDVTVEVVDASDHYRAVLDELGLEPPVQTMAWRPSVCSTASSRSRST